MLIIGLDPEYSRSGIAIWRDGKVILSDCKTPSNADKSYERVLVDAWYQSQRIERLIRQINDAEKIVFSECPPPNGLYSAGLWGLDVMLHSSLVNREGCVLYRLYPNYLDHVHGKRSSKKSEHVQTAMEILSYFEWSTVEGKKPKKINHDIADAVIFMARGLARYGQLPKELIDKYPGLSHEKEKLVDFTVA